MRLGISDDSSLSDKLRKLWSQKAKTVAGFLQLHRLLLMHGHEAPCVHRQFVESIQRISCEFRLFVNVYLSSVNVVEICCGKSLPPLLCCV